MSKCNYCINKTECDNCDKKWKDKFIPSEEVKHYFHKTNLGYMFDNFNTSLKSTHAIFIDSYNNPYCPYCGERMYHIQDKDTPNYDTIGYCCICEGTRAELEYEERRKDLLEKHEEELDSLKKEYSNKLTFCSDRLLEIKHEEDKRRFSSRDFNHFCTLNGKPYTDIDQMTD